MLTLRWPSRSRSRCTTPTGDWRRRWTYYDLPRPRLTRFAGSPRARARSAVTLWSSLRRSECSWSSRNGDRKRKTPTRRGYRMAETTTTIPAVIVLVSRLRRLRDRHVLPQDGRRVDGNMWELLFQGFALVLPVTAQPGVDVPCLWLQRHRSLNNREHGMVTFC